MAKAKTTKNQKSMEETLWDSANKLRGSVESSEYKHIVLGLIFLKFVSDTFEERKEQLIKEGKEAFIDMVEFYTMENVFYLPEESRWSYIKQNAKQDDISLKIDTALSTIEKNNPSLKGALPDNYFSRLNLDVSKLSSLIDTINNINTIEDKGHDIVGRVYEYFLSNFAIAEGKGKGEFYTPKSIVNLIANMIEPYKGKIYDPACGSGGMFVQSIKFIEAHKGNKKDISIYGQEYTVTTYKLAKMNLAIRGISANLGDVPADTFSKDQHKDLKADFIMANPPFNQKDWRGTNELLDDPRWAGYDVPPTSNANYGWILNMVSKLSVNGVAGFILANGALSGGGEEYKIRKKLIENDLVEAIVILPRNLFYTTDISVTLWILNANKKKREFEQNGVNKIHRDRTNEILFMDLRQKGVPFEKKFTQFDEETINEISTTYHTWQSDKDSYKDIAEYCYSASKDEVEKKDYSLVPSKYIEFVNRDENIDFDTKMTNLQSEFTQLLKDEEAIVSTSYTVFEIIDTNELISEYLMMWFRREEFDRYARYMSHGSTREAFGWEEMCDVELPVPSPDKQKKIVKEYHTITDRIKLNEELNQKLEDTAQSIYKEWFVNFEFPDENGKPYKSNGGEMEYCEELDMEIPVIMNVKPISNLISVKDGTHDSPQPLNVGRPLVTSTHLEKYNILEKDAYCISEQDFIQINKRSKVEQYDILISMIGTVGNISYIRQKEINFAIKNVGLFKTSEKSELANFILFYLKSPIFNNYLTSSLLGSTQSYITLTGLRNIPLLISNDEKLIEKFNEHINPIVDYIYKNVSITNKLYDLKEILLSKMATIKD